MTPVLALTAMAAMALVVFRAWTQSISIDEANNYILFVAGDQPFHWAGSVVNHVLNTALMRLATRLFDLSELTARLPALVGAAFYISACYRYCKRLEGGLLLRWLALVCFVFSPFILDYLVVARGYGLALGFLMTALVADPKKLSGCVAISTCLGLCFAANFAFAFTCAAAMALLFVTSWRESEIAKGKLIVAYALPALLTVWIVSLPNMLHYPRAELFYGAHSLVETFESLLVSQLGHHSLRLYLPIGLIALAGLVGTRGRLPQATILFGGAFVCAAAMHFVAHHALGLLYPMDRTGVFFVPLAFGAMAATAAVSGGWLRIAQVAALGFAAILNFAFLRVDQFEEWNFNKDTARLYSKLVCLHSRDKVERIASGWPFIATTNFYRLVYPGELPQVLDSTTVNPAAEVYLMDITLNKPQLDAEKLVTIWRSKASEAVIAVPPDQVSRFQGSSCF